MSDFKLQQEALKFHDICVNWSFPKTDLVTDFLNLEIRSFEKDSIVIFRQIFNIPLLNNLFISFFSLFISLTEMKNIH